MTRTTINISIPFQLLRESISKITLDEKIKITDILEHEIIKEFDVLENDDKVKNEIKDARKAYKSGEFLTLEDNLSKRNKKS
jgi:hypothetical protein